MRVGILTGGGDCPGLNAVIRAVTKSLVRQCGAEVIGIEQGFLGLIERRVRPLDLRAVAGIVATGGTILGTHNRVNPFGHFGAGGADVLDIVVAYVHELGLDAIVVIGGDGSMAISHRLSLKGVPIVGCPQTIDNDIEGTERSFGFDTAVATVTDALERVQTTGQSHGRVMICETMGRYAGWIAITAGISGGGDVILIPEIPFHLERVCAKIIEREREGKRFTLVVVAEGAREQGADFVTAGGAEASREARLGGIGAVVAAGIQKRTGKETRVCVLGHLQRGGAPTSFDRQLCTRFGTRAVQLIAEEKYGHMVALRPPDTIAVPITEAIGRLRLVPLEGDLVQTARALGISLGD